MFKHRWQKKMKPAGTDSRILSLAAEVAKSPEQNVPVILLKLKGKKILLQLGKTLSKYWFCHDTELAF